MTKWNVGKKRVEGRESFEMSEKRGEISGCVSFNGTAGEEELRRHGEP